MSSRQSSRSSRLPNRFPIGTRYVIEGRGGLIHLRYLEYPDGQRVALPLEGGARRGAGELRRGAITPRRRRPERSKKILQSDGTVRELAR
jgi:hypothetical protein